MTLLARARGVGKVWGTILNIHPCAGKPGTFHGIQLLSQRIVPELNPLFFMELKLDLLFSDLSGPNNLGSVFPS